MIENANPALSSVDKVLRQSVEQYLASWPDPTPSFDFRIGWSRDYEQLFLEQFDETTSIDGIVAKIQESGRVLIAAKGGSAKTTVVNRLLRSVIANPDALPILIDVNRWQAPLYETWRALPENWVARVNFLLENLSVPKSNVAVLGALDPGITRTVFVDGINEVSSSVSQDILASLDEFVGRAPHTFVIVTDQLVRRYLRDTLRWRIGTILPLDNAQIMRLLKERFGSESVWKQTSIDEGEILKIPFFLNQMLHSEKPTKSRAATFEEFFAKHALTGLDLDRAAQAAFLMYRDERARAFSSAGFELAAGLDIKGRLTEAGALREFDGKAYFAHHLQHDYLASRYLAQHPEEWNPTIFDRMTFRASSFDILALCLDQLTTSESSDQFLILTYDWNLYGTAYALADAYTPGRVSAEMEVVVAAMLADRKWDLIVSTAQRARDALALFPPGCPARAFLELENKKELYEATSRMQSSKNWFSEWQSLFTISDEASVPDSIVERILDEHSIIGWTTSNVLRRVRLSEIQESNLRQWVTNRPPTIVWRIAHVFGTHPSPENRDLLLELVGFNDFWVQYGAIRSLIEMAASAAVRLRRSIFSHVRNLIPGLSQRIVEDLDRVLFIDPSRAPRDWGEHAMGVIRALFSQIKSENRDRWTDDIARIQTMYPPE